MWCKISVNYTFSKPSVQRLHILIQVVSLQNSVSDPKELYMWRAPLRLSFWSLHRDESKELQGMKVEFYKGEWGFCPPEVTCNAELTKPHCKAMGFFRKTKVIIYVLLIMYKFWQKSSMNTSTDKNLIP